MSHPHPNFETWIYNLFLPENFPHVIVEALFLVNPDLSAPLSSSRESSLNFLFLMSNPEVPDKFSFTPTLGTPSLRRPHASLTLLMFLPLLTLVPTTKVSSFPISIFSLAAVPSPSNPTTAPIPSMGLGHGVQFKP
jgi:hypothetical protein